MFELTNPNILPNDEDHALRPRNFDEYIGQDKNIENLKIFIKAAKNRGESLDHILLSGPPGLGKTSLAYIIAEELGVSIRPTSGPVIQRSGELVAMLNSLQSREVLFIDEIHRLSRPVEEVLYSAMEDFRVDVLIGHGPGAQSVPVVIPPFTLVGATTRSGLLSRPLRDRFQIQCTMDFYQPEQLQTIALKSALRLQVPLEKEAAYELARRSRGTPRIANRLLRRVRDFAEVLGNGTITFDLTKEALARLGVDDEGLNELDRRILSAIHEKFDGGPVGLDNLATAIGEEADTIENSCEPFLIIKGFVQRTRQGRIITSKGRAHLGIQESHGPLFD